MVQHFGQISLIGINVLTVVLAALIFYVVAAWFDVLAHRVAIGNKPEINKDEYHVAFRLAMIWTVFVIIIIVTASLVFSLFPTSKDIPDWGGHEVSKDVRDAIKIPEFIK
ncbi:MAG: hypothetical protein Harvfovirus9_8 [Harvfovirus sp.]|uniref:Uncharacterized protein n=1 Tax=Harvfovirus sp. TaxID=2487768 RepID=A0A3G5A0Z2_9VIRU|nr:MAG: hypothetical protein Harvfovirus9_8 [Harvfovirus sp.]